MSPVSYGKTFVGTTSSIALAQPFIVRPGPARGGIPFGKDIMDGGSRVTLDLMGWGKAGATHSTRVGVFGQLRAGKSACMKAITRRLAPSQVTDEDGIPVDFSIRANDRKMGEYAELTRVLHSHTITVGSGEDSIRFNPFDPMLNMGEVHMVDIAMQYAQDAKGESLRRHEPLAMQVGVYKMLQSGHPSVEALEEILWNMQLTWLSDYLTSNSIVLASAATESPIDTMAERMAPLQGAATPGFIGTVNTSDFLEDAGLCAGYLARITRGNYGRAIGGAGSMIDQLSQRMTTIVWGDSNDRAQDLVEATLHRWKIVARHSQDKRLRRIIPHLEISDETNKALTRVSGVYLRALSEEMRDARADHTAALVASQYLRDFYSAGGSDPTLQGLAKGINDAFAGRIIFRQPDDDDVLHDLTRYMSDLDARWCTRLPRGYAALVVPNYPTRFVRVILTPSDRRITYSDQANDRQVASRRSVWDDPDFLARAVILGHEIPASHKHLVEPPTTTHQEEEVQ